MAEHDLWHTLRDAAKIYGHFERIENMVGRGRPDVNYCVTGVEGNIELKQILRWPARPESPVSVPHFTPQQRIWIRTRLSAGGRVFVLLEVVRPVVWYGLLPGEWARLYLDKSATEAEVRAAALASGERRFPIAPIMGQLTLRESTT